MSIQKEPYCPSWTAEEKAAVKKALPLELGQLAALIARGKRKGAKAIAETIWAMNRKVHEAKRMEITQATGFSHLDPLDPLVQDIATLAEFAPSSTEIQGRIFVRLREAFLATKVEEEFLARVTPANKKDSS